MSCAGVEPRSEADCEYTLDSGMLIKDIGYRCYSQIWNCYSYGKLIKGDEKASALADALRAIDGARTRGLDLGKVARYQLRHYRIYDVS